jgi:hypothetical protein
MCHAGTPMEGTRLLFPFDVAPLEPGHSLGITEWSWAVPSASTATLSADYFAQLQSIFMQPTVNVVRLNGLAQDKIIFI